MTKVGKAALALAAVAVVAVAVVSGGSAASQQARTVTIGWAYDGVGAMAPFDGPALATAKTRIAEVNRTSATKLRLITCNTQGNKPAVAKACATKLLSQGADIIMTTCDVDFAAPVVQTAINAREAHGRGVHRHGSDGPEALRCEGAARLLVRERRAGRGLRDGRVRLEARLADGLARDGHGHRLLPKRRAGVREALHAARREDRGEGDVPVARRQPGVVAEHGDTAQRRGRGRHRHVDRGGVRRSGADPQRAADAREQHAVPQLVGR